MRKENELKIKKNDFVQFCCVFLCLWVLPVICLLGGCSGNTKTKPGNSIYAQNDVVKIKDFKGMEIPDVTNPSQEPSEKKEISEEDVEKELLDRYSYSDFFKTKDTNKPIKMDDYVTYDIVCDGKVIEEDDEMEICDDDAKSSLDGQLIGHRAGEKAEVLFPCDDTGNIQVNVLKFSPEEKTKKAIVHIKSVKEADLSGMTDDWVKSSSRLSENLKEYRQEIREYLSSEHEDATVNNIRPVVSEMLLEKVSWVKKPEKEIDDLYKKKFDFMKTSSEPDVDYEEMREVYMEVAESQVKLWEAIKLIAEKENITCSETDILETEHMLNLHGFDYADWSEEDLIMLFYGGPYSLEEATRFDKVCNLIYESGKKVNILQEN